MNNKLCSLIYLTIKKASNLGKTKLVKLTYLSDYEHYKIYGKTITGIEYFLHHYGPYSNDIDSSIKKLSDSETILAILGTSPYTGRNYYSYFTTSGFDYSKYLALEEIETIDYVLQRYGREQLDIILNIAYETVPMKNVKMEGEILDFSSPEPDLLKNLKNIKSKIKKTENCSSEFDYDIPRKLLNQQVLIAAAEE